MVGHLLGYLAIVFVVAIFRSLMHLAAFRQNEIRELHLKVCQMEHYLQPLSCDNLNCSLQKDDDDPALMFMLLVFG